MTGLEAIPKIATLLTELIKRVKDGKTAALVQEIQSLHQTIIVENARLLSENSQLKQDLAEAQTKRTILTEVSMDERG